MTGDRSASVAASGDSWHHHALHPGEGQEKGLVLLVASVPLEPATFKFLITESCFISEECKLHLGAVEYYYDVLLYSEGPYQTLAETGGLHFLLLSELFNCQTVNNVPSQLGEQIAPPPPWTGCQQCQHEDDHVSGTGLHDQLQIGLVSKLAVHGTHLTVLRSTIQPPSTNSRTL